MSLNGLVLAAGRVWLGQVDRDGYFAGAIHDGGEDEGFRAVGVLGSASVGGSLWYPMLDAGGVLYDNRYGDMAG